MSEFFTFIVNRKIFLRRSKYSLPCFIPIVDKK